jgi:hypothetical protein
MAPLYDHSPESGLHLLKDAWGQKQHLDEQSKSLAEKLNVAIEATLEAAPLRTQGFALSRPATEGISETREESLLEAAMLARWNQPGLWEIPGAWSRLVAFQTPLFAEQKKGSWGYVDLLGVDAVGLPVVVELKKSPKATNDGRTETSESPLRMVLEAAAYAISLRKNWEQFRVEWVSLLLQLDVPNEVIDRVPAELTDVPLVAAAPASFWMDWLPYTTKGRSMMNWDGLCELLCQFEESSLPVQFASISGDYSRPESLAVQLLDHLPWSIQQA